jgi:hypothetical protein
VRALKNRGWRYDGEIRAGRAQVWTKGSGARLELPAAPGHEVSRAVQVQVKKILRARR